MSSQCLGRRRLILSVLLLVIALLYAMPAPSLSLAQATQDPQPPEVGARAAIVVEYPSGRILYAKNAHDQLAPASTTKILTAILAMEYGSLDDVVTVAPQDLVGESTMGLQSGEQQTLRTLLYGMLLPSGNDAAMAVARYLGSKTTSGDPSLTDPVARFVQMMNVRARQLGLQDSRFVNPHGLDTNGHYSSAYDLASLSWYALHFPIFNDIVRTTSYDAPGHPLLNTNEMLTRYAGADGIKTGWTDAAGLCLITSATRDGRRLISVVLNAPQWYADSSALLDYGFARLAAAPTFAGFDTLSVAQRGAVSWLLVNAAPAPPMPVPVATSGVPLSGQGGGLAAALPADNKEALGAASQPQARDLEVALMAQPQQKAGSYSVSIVFLAFIVLMVGGLLLISRLFGRSPASALARVKAHHFLRRQAQEPDMLPPMAVPGGNQPLPLPQPPRSRAPATPPGSHQPQPLIAARTLGSPPGHRKEPNLLTTSEQASSYRIARALALAEEGRQGSSMSDFLIALRLGATLEVAELAAQYQMNSTAFLALARAQQAAGQIEAARQTLLHGTLVLPHDRLLSLALKQLTTH